MRVALFPQQIVAVPLTLAVGTEFTVTVTFAELVHPFAPVTVTEYEVFVVGETGIETFVELVFHTEVPTPLAVSVVVCPVQIVVPPVMLMVGG